MSINWIKTKKTTKTTNKQNKTNRSKCISAQPVGNEQNLAQNTKDKSSH